MCRYGLFPALLFLASCATLFNSKKITVRVVTKEPCFKVLNKDSINRMENDNFFSVERNNKPLELKLYTDSNSKTLLIKPRNSFAYWLNWYPNWHLWTGFWIDTKTKKRYTYPRVIYTDVRDSGRTYLQYIPPDTVYNRYSNLIKISPFKLVAPEYSSFELSWERKTGRRSALQLMGSYLLPMSIWNVNSSVKPNIRGLSTSIEEKFYIKEPAPFGTYLSFEFSYLNCRHQDLRYFGPEKPTTDTSHMYVHYPDTFGIKKQTFSFNFKMGYQFIRKRMALDVYAGFGLRYRDVTHFNRINPDDKMDIPRHFNYGSISTTEGRFWTISVPLNIRLGWMF